MSRLIRKWFSSGTKSKKDKSKKDSRANEAAHQLVESCLSSLPMESISTGDYYRLYHTLLDWSRQETKLAGRTHLILNLTHFNGIINAESATPARLAIMLELPNLNCELAQWLVRTFPSVNNLEIQVQEAAFDVNETVFNSLLFEPMNGRNWARQLTRLTYHPAQGTLWHAILPKLTSANFPRLMTLCIYSEERMGVDGFVFDLPILSQLSSLAIDTQDDHFSFIWPALKVHINEEPLPAKRVDRRFWLYTCLREPLLCEVLCTMTSHFAAQIGGLNVKLPPLRSSPGENGNSPRLFILSSLARKFHALVYLHLKAPHAEHYALIPLVRALVPLASLIGLKLILGSHKQLPVAGTEISAHDRKQTPPKLSKVSIQVKKVCHGAFHVPTIVHGLFPAARPVGVTFMRCETCRKPTQFKSHDGKLANVDPCWSQVLVGAGKDDICYNFFV